MAQELEKLLEQAKKIKKELLKVTKLPDDVDTSEIETELEEIHGHAMQLQLKLNNGDSLDIKVLSRCTVEELYQQVERVMTRRNGAPINWKYFWSKWRLHQREIPLSRQDQTSLRRAGVERNSRIRFERIPIRRKKRHGRRY